MEGIMQVRDNKGNHHGKHEKQQNEIPQFPMVSADCNHDMEISCRRFIVKDVDCRLGKTRLHCVCETLRPYAGIHDQYGLVACNYANARFVALAEASHIAQCVL